ncbi:MAG TPA: HK97 family phage prohead protease [Mycobacteriales bacterium]|nr:HK97 family phage prohead protease [Mycobacteriales bacterium]
MPEEISPLWCVRELRSTPRIRAAAGDDQAPTLFGHFSAVNEWYEIDSMFEGHFLERTAPGFPIVDGNTQILFNHGFDVLGIQVIAAIRSIDPSTTAYEGDLFSVPQLLIDGLRAGVYGSSFRFQVIEDNWDYQPDPSDYNPTALPERTIVSAAVPEFGPVTFPANPASDSGARSATDRFYEQLLRHRPDQVDALAARSLELRSPSGRSDARRADGGQQGSETGQRPDPSSQARDRALRLNGVIK